MPRNPQSNIIWATIRNPQCSLCDLYKEAQTVCLLGDGPVPCDGLVLGEAPGYREDEIEIPFSGRSGQLLRKELKAIELNPKELYITNVVACRPPENRTPSRVECRTCSSHYLDPQFALVKPKAVLVLGNTALAYVMGRKHSITKAEGTTLKRKGITYVFSRHPASLLHGEDQPGYPYVLQKFRENLLLFKRVLNPQVVDVFRFIKCGTLPEFDEGPVTVDIETNGLNPFLPDSKIHCMAVAQDPDKVYATKFDLAQVDRYRDLLRKHPIIVQRGTFEGTWFKKHLGIVPKIHFDVKLGAYSIDENEQSGLKYQAVKHLNVMPWVEEMDFTNPDMSVLLPYNARDTAYELRLYRERDLPYLRKRPKMARLLKHILFPAEEVFTSVICRGFHIDVEKAASRLKQCEDNKQFLARKIARIAGHDINPASSKQMAALLYDELKLPCPVKTEHDAPSSSEAALIRISHPVAALTLEWRQWNKYAGTYLRPWITHGPILHANYGFTDVDTGRLNSTMVKNHRGEKRGSTLHQCPRDGFIRNLVTPRFSDFVMVAADWSQIELRLVAEASGDRTMLEIFNNDEDIHMATASDLVRGEITKEMRKRAKAVNFGFVYGMMPPKFIKYAKEKFETDLTLHEADRYREQFFNKYSGLLPWHRRIEAFVTTNGYVDSVWGRRRHLPEAKHDSGLFDWKRSEFVRKAINAPIQSGASDLNLFMAALIMPSSLPWVVKVNPKNCLLVGAAHDSLISECRRSYVPELKEIIQHTVDHLPTWELFKFRFRVKLKMDVIAYQSCWEGKILAD